MTAPQKWPRDGWTALRIPDGGKLPADRRPPNASCTAATTAAHRPEYRLPQAGGVPKQSRLSIPRWQNRVCHFNRTGSQERKPRISSPWTETRNPAQNFGPPYDVEEEARSITHDTGRNQTHHNWRCSKFRAREAFFTRRQPPRMARGGPVFIGCFKKRIEELNRPRDKAASTGLIP
jgi:hypothetical protein